MLEKHIEDLPALCLNRYVKGLRTSSPKGMWPNGVHKVRSLQKGLANGVDLLRSDKPQERRNQSLVDPGGQRSCCIIENTVNLYVAHKLSPTIKAVLARNRKLRVGETGKPLVLA